MKFKFPIAVAGTVALAGIAYAGLPETGFGSPHPAQSHSAPPAAPMPSPGTASQVLVATTRVTPGDMAVELEGLGHVQAFNTVTVRTQVEGQIEKLAYTQGALVHQGDVLAQIDPRLFQAKLDQDSAALKRDQAHLANAIANLNRFAPLARNGFASGQQVDTQQAMVAQLQATLKVDDAVIAQDRVQLDYATIKAPITGVAGLRLVDEGNVVHPTDTNGLVSIAEIQPIAVLFTLPQSDLYAVQKSLATAGAQGLAVEAWSQDGKTRLDVGHLETIDNRVDMASGTITLRADFPNAGRLLWPGEFVSARLIREVRHDALTVPAAVIQRGLVGTYAWVVQPDGKAVSTAIQVARIQHGTALIDTGLAAGDVVVTDGQYALQNGETVRTQPADAAATQVALRNAQTDRLGIAP